MPTLHYFASTAKGLEDVLASELASLGCLVGEIGPGGVSFSGTCAEGYRACLWLRSATRVLQSLGSFPCDSNDALYEGVSAFPWEDFLSPSMTLAVDAHLRKSALKHSGYVALKTKDAIVDRLRQKYGARPNVDVRTPDLRVNVYLAYDTCTVSLDLAGSSLHRRGYRQNPGLAPLRETLAAALLLKANWNVDNALVDPMCGSGTIPLEAALLRTKTAPGLLTGPFSFEKWPGFDRQHWDQLLDEARSLIKTDVKTCIYGFDQDFKALREALRNAERIPAGNVIRWRQADFLSLSPPEDHGTLLFNPPYGERIGHEQQLVDLYKSIGDNLKKRWTGWTAWILTGNPNLAKCIGLRASRRLVLFNGPIECRFLKYDLY